MRVLLLALLLGFGLGLPARAADELVFIAARNHSEPLSVWEGERLSGGLIKELSDLLAGQLGRQPRYLTRPAKRAPDALRAGEGDLLCYTRAAWIGDDFHFTETVIPNAEAVAAATGMARLGRLEELRGEVVGTVLGYQYGEVEMRGRFRREDAPDMAANLRKLGAGRLRYALTDLISLRGAQRARPQEGMQLALLLQPFDTVCALSRRSALPPAELDAALRALKRSGQLQALLRRYG